MNTFLVIKTWLVVFFTLFSSFLFAQTLATIDGNPVNSAEFLWVYNKNNAKAGKPNFNELNAYLNLYLNFKLKVAEAKALGLNLEDSYKQEILGYETALKAQNNSPRNAQEHTYIMNEYREGVLMFNISEQKIWNKALDDELELKPFFIKHAENYEGKSFEETKGQVIGDYHHELEKYWIKDLRSKHTITINQAELKKLAKQ